MQNVKEMYGSVTVVLAGEMDHCTAPQIRRQLDEILEDPGVRPDFYGFLRDRRAAGTAAHPAAAGRHAER